MLKVVYRTVEWSSAGTKENKGQPDPQSSVKYATPQVDVRVFLIRIRIKKEITQKQLAKLTHLPVKAIANFEAGRGYSPHVIKKIKEALGLRVFL
jgi:DNA-binding XRE family transcriptional regulator